MEKGNGTGETPATATDGAVSGTAIDPGTGTGTGSGTQADQSGADSDAGGGQTAAGSAGPSRVRDPWAGTPDVGETTLPDGTKLRRDADGNMHRGPDANGDEYVWDANSGEWLRDADRVRHHGSEGWGDPAQDWHDAWGGEPLPEEWRDVPRSGSTMLPEGSLRRDAAGNYQLDAADGRSYRWNEQGGRWYDAQTGHTAPDGVGGDPVDGWLRGAQADAQVRADPSQPHPFRRTIQP